MLRKKRASMILLAATQRMEATLFLVKNNLVSVFG
jgi:hypothetical protein